MIKLIARLKLRYLLYKLNKYAKRKYRIIEIRKDDYRLQVYSNLSIICYKDKNKIYKKGRETDDWQWHEIYVSSLIYENLKIECDSLRRDYKKSLIRSWRNKKKPKENYPKVVY